MLTKSLKPASPGAYQAASERQAPQGVSLTPRQREVLALLCQGFSNKLICRHLQISPGTVKVHMAVILRELGVSSRVQAVLAAHRLGLDSKEVEQQELTGTASADASLRRFELNVNSHDRQGASVLHGDDNSPGNSALLVSDGFGRKPPASSRFTATRKPSHARAAERRFSDEVLLSTWRSSAL